MPHHITFDRSYIHGSYDKGTRRGIAANAGQGTTSNSGNPGNNGSAPQDDVIITNSYFADFKDPGADSQAVCVWNGYGPFRFENNYFEGAGENVMFGRADPSIRYLVPSDIKIVHNHFYKPLAWYTGAQAAQTWWVKNLLELKSAQNVIIDSNVFQHDWVDQQKGTAIVFTPRNQGGKSTWTVVQNVTFRNNVVMESAGGIGILGYDDIHRSRQLNSVTIYNNLFLDINTTGRWGSSTAPLFQISNATDRLTIDHNTAFNSKAITYSFDKPSTNFTFTANVVAHNVCGLDNHLCGMSGDSVATGINALNKYFVNPVVQYNEMYGNTENHPYPSPNDFAAASFMQFDTSYVMTSPGYTDGKGVTAGIDGTVMSNVSGVVQYCTSSGVSCATNP